jgi:hypothetical protein
VNRNTHRAWCKCARHIGVAVFISIIAAVFLIVRSLDDVPGNPVPYPMPNISATP